MKDKIIKMLQDGYTYTTICTTLNVAKSTVAYHAKKHELHKTEGVKHTNYDWDQVQLVYDTGLCLKELAITTGISTTAITSAIKTGKLKIDRKRLCSDQKELPNDYIFKSNSTTDVGVVKRRIRRDSLIPYVCHVTNCPLSQLVIWNGDAITLHLDHVNGIRTDHRLENLRWLCPNCHSQTPTYCGRNKNGGSARIRTEDDGSLEVPALGH